MRIIFIRHGDPDYVNDTLTEKGIREAVLLADRVASWENITDFYCSPLGRAKKTASYSLEKVNRTAITYEWLKEFSYFIDDPTTQRHGVPWDFMPQYWCEIPELYDKNKWKETAIYQSNPELLPAYKEVCEGIDSILAKYGYQRYHNYYVTNHKENISSEETSSQDATIVIFCHLGVTFFMMSHLLGISPTVLCQHFFVAPTSVTVLATEERIPGQAAFRTQVVGDVSHLKLGNEPVSSAGYFTDAFQG